MALHLSVIVALGQMIDLSQMAHRQVADLMAASAYKVIVGADPGVKTVCTVPKAQLLDLPSSTRRFRFRYTVPRLILGNSSRMLAYRASAVGWSQRMERQCLSDSR